MGYDQDFDSDTKVDRSLLDRDYPSILLSI